MSAESKLVPDPDAQAVAEQLVAATDVQRTVLEETIASGESGVIRESGRTLCAETDQLREPGARFDDHVLLESCPVGAIGIWHSHPTVGQLRRPEHSLPDVANVVFGHNDASMIVGTDHAEVLVAGEDNDAMREEFQNALGLAVSSPAEVFQALQSGQIPDPPATRQAVRAELAPLFSRPPTGFTDLTERLEQSTIPAHSTVEQAGLEGMTVRASVDVGNIRETARRTSPITRDLSEMGQEIEIDIREVALGSAVGTVIGNLTNMLLFPRER